MNYSFIFRGGNGETELDFFLLIVDICLNTDLSFTTIQWKEAPLLDFIG